MSPESQRGDIERILVPMDGSECSEKAVALAGDLARKLGGKVHVLFVSETNYAGPWYYYVLDDVVTDRIQKKAKKIVDKTAAALRCDGVGEVETQIKEGHPGEVIPDMASKLDTDLIVMGTHGRRGLERALLGSVAREVANTTTVPLLLIK